MFNIIIHKALHNILVSLKQRAKLLDFKWLKLKYNVLSIAINQSNQSVQITLAMLYLFIHDNLRKFEIKILSKISLQDNRSRRNGSGERERERRGEKKYVGIDGKKNERNRERINPKKKKNKKYIFNRY